MNYRPSDDEVIWVAARGWWRTGKVVRTTEETAWVAYQCPSRVGVVYTKKCSIGGGVDMLPASATPPGDDQVRPWGWGA